MTKPKPHKVRRIQPSTPPGVPVPAKRVDKYQTGWTGPPPKTCNEECDDARSASPYKPGPFEIAGLTLAGVRQKDGSVRIGFDNEPGDTLVPDWPDCVEVCGTVYTLEDVKQNTDKFGKLHNNIEWGEYA